MGRSAWRRCPECELPSWRLWQLFQSTFIKILYPGASILLTLEWTLLNSAVSLVRPPMHAIVSICVHACPVPALRIAHSTC